jgi:hypothetical protein
MVGEQLVVQMLNDTTHVARLGLLCVCLSLFALLLMRSSLFVGESNTFHFCCGGWNLELDLKLCEQY